MSGENYDDSIKRQFQAEMDLQNNPSSIGFGPAKGGGICICQDRDVILVPTIDGLWAVIETLLQIAEAWGKSGKPTRPDGWEDGANQEGP